MCHFREQYETAKLNFDSQHFGNVSDSANGTIGQQWQSDLDEAGAHLDYGKVIITVAVVAILISAPIGAIGIRYTCQNLNIAPIYTTTFEKKKCLKTR